MLSGRAGQRQEGNACAAFLLLMKPGVRGRCMAGGGVGWGFMTSAYAYADGLESCLWGCPLYTHVFFIA